MPQETVGVQSLDPLHVEDVGLRASAAAGKLPRLHEVDLEALRFKEFEERNPVDPGGFHSDRFHTALLQPRGDLVKIGGIGAELPDWFGVTIGGDADHMHVGMNVDSGRVRVDELERRRRGRDGDGSDLACESLGLARVLRGFFGSWFGTTMDVSCSRMGVEKQEGAASQEGYRGRLKSPQRDQYHAGRTWRGKSPMTRSKPLGPCWLTGKKHQRVEGRRRASP